MKHTLLLTLLVVLYSCGSSDKSAGADGHHHAATQDTSLEGQVMQVHDEVMPRMGELHSVQKQLLALVDSTSITDTTLARQYALLANQIKLSNEAMMDWMRAYNPAFDGPEEDVKAYLEKELEKINKVKTDMEKSLSEAKKAIGKE